MSHQPRFLFAVLLALLLTPALAARAGGPLEGRWRLAEQSYQQGRSDLARDEAGLVLVFGGPTGPRVLDPRRDAGEAAWPAVFTDEGAAPVEVIARKIDPAAGTARAVYRLVPPDGDGWTLDLVESYAIDEAGHLTGTLRVTMTRDGQPAGGYTLHRTFARVR